MIRCGVTSNSVGTSRQFRTQTPAPSHRLRAAGEGPSVSHKHCIKLGATPRFRIHHQLMKIKIKLTPDDLRLGKRWNPSCCPIARRSRITLKSTPGVPKFKSLVVYPNKLALLRDGEFPIAVSILPEKAQQFILGFDSRKEMKPISFSIDL